MHRKARFACRPPGSSQPVLTGGTTSDDSSHKVHFGPARLGTPCPLLAWSVPGAARDRSPGYTPLVRLGGVSVLEWLPDPDRVSVSGWRRGPVVDCRLAGPESSGGDRDLPGRGDQFRGVGGTLRPVRRTA